VCAALDHDDEYIALVGREVQKQSLAIGREIETRDAMRVIVPEQEPRARPVAGRSVDGGGVNGADEDHALA
jgi:hypothetical protein